MPLPTFSGFQTTIPRPSTPPICPIQSEPPLEVARRRLYNTCLTRDQKIRVQTLNETGLFDIHGIARQLNITYAQVINTLNSQQLTPQFRKRGRHLKIHSQKMQEIINFVRMSRKNRQTSPARLHSLFFPDNDVSLRTLIKTMHHYNYRRCVAIAKPPLSQKNIDNRLAWALEHVDWTIKEWESILWSDETWVNHSHRKRRIWRMPGEEHNETCIVNSGKMKGWMWWGTFHGSTKGPAVFWEPSWGTIGALSYRVSLLSHVKEYIEQYRTETGKELFFMQDNAGGHAVWSSRDWLEYHRIPYMHWPAYSPDLNPIEKVWNKMKGWIARNYPDGSTRIVQNRRIVREAWDAVGADVLREQIQNMHQRCLDVIAAGGQHTTW